jgi:hypothetical protein
VQWWTVIIQSAGALGVVAWLGKLAVTRTLDLLAENHRRRLDHEREITLKRMDAELQVVTHLAQTRGSSLVTQQFSAIETLYQKLVEAEEVWQRIRFWSEHALGDDGGRELLQQAMTVMPDMLRTANRARLWLSSETCSSLDNFVELVLGFMVTGAVVGMTTKFSKDHPRSKQLLETLATGAEAISTARTELEYQLRALSGVDASPMSRPGSRIGTVLAAIESMRPMLRTLSGTKI